MINSDNNELGKRPDYLNQLDADDDDFEYPDDSIEQAPVLMDENNHTLPFNLIDELESTQVRQLIHKTYRDDSALARDVAYLGMTDLNYVLSNHGITQEELKQKLENPNFVNMVERFTADIGKDTGGMLRVRSNAYLDTGISRLYGMIMNQQTKDENVIKAMTLLSQLGGAIPKTGENAGNGTSIVFNFGSDNPMIQAKKIIEG